MDNNYESNYAFIVTANVEECPHSITIASSSFLTWEIPNSFLTRSE